MTQPTSNPTRDSADARRSRWIVLVVALAMAAIAYFNAIPGEFVYDDDGQIVDNAYIQDSRHTWTALTSDVWAYKGERAEAWSNYWRPVFMLWLIANHRLFGLDSAGWHVTNILLHLAVLVLVWRLLIRLRVTPAVSAGVLWIFAVHPVHVESVTWISGSPDLLLGIFLLGSLLAFLACRESPSPAMRATSWLLYAFGTFCKEVSVVFPGVIFVAEWGRDTDPAEPWTRMFVRSLRAAAPYLALAVGFLLLRQAVLGTFARQHAWAPSVAGRLLSVPAVLVFYVRQALFPYPIGPAYPLRAVEPDSVGVLNFFVPAAIAVGLFVAGAWLWRRGTVYKLGIALFVLPLAPAMNIAAFLPEQIVHDRYLYLPLLGLLLVVIGGLGEIAARFFPRAADRAIYVGSFLVALVLGAITIEYNRAWHDDVALWERGVRVDPGSSHTLGQLGYYYRQAGRIEEAKEILDRALAVNPDVTQTILDRAIIDAEENRLAEAERGFRRVLEAYPGFEPALDQLGDLLSRQNRLEESLETFRTARERLPYRRVKYTLNIAVLQVRLQQPALALTELESIRSELDRESDPEMLRGYYLLGELYRMSGRSQDAFDAYRTYLTRTEGVDHPSVHHYRPRAERRLGGGAG